MTRRSASRPSDLKLDNKVAILQHVYHFGISSKSDIYNEIGLSKPTASVLIDELVRNGILKSMGLGTSTGQGGKRPELFEFNEDVGLVIGLHVRADAVQGILTNLRLEVRQRESITLSNTDVTGVLEAMSGLIDKFFDEASHARIPVLGIGVSVPGTIDPAHGIIVHSVLLHNWSNVPVGDYLALKYKVPVFVDNESRNTALAEKWFGVGVNQGISTFITLQTEDGLGIGVVLRGATSLGSGYSFGEFGHTTINFDGPLCRCGNHGCWELYATEQALLESVQNGSEGWGLPSTLIDELKQRTPLSLPLLAGYYKDGDEFARTQVELYIERLAIGIVNLVNAFSPEMIVLHGSLFFFGESLLDLIRNFVRRVALPPAANAVRIAYSEVGSAPATLGAATAVIRAAIEERVLIS